MKHDEIRALSADIALAVRVHGQKIADQARREKMGGGAADLIMKFFNQAADAAEARGIMLALAAMDIERKGKAKP